VFWRAFRRKWGNARQGRRRVEYCGFVEWTTGRSSSSGGKRRIHVHYLLKGLDLRAGEQVCDPELERKRSARSGVELARSLPCRCGRPYSCVECWVRREWRSLVGAWVVEARPIRTPAGAIAYFAPHHSKQAQGPPAGWSGKRFRPSKGYFNAPVEELRGRAELELARERAARQGRPVTLRESIARPLRRRVPGGELERVRRLLAAQLVDHCEHDTPRAIAGELVNPLTGEVYPRDGYGDAEWEELVLLAAAEQFGELEEDRLRRKLEEYRRWQARAAVDRRRRARREKAAASS
jgi:hypothetical protein